MKETNRAGERKGKGKLGEVSKEKIHLSYFGGGKRRKKGDL